MVANMAVYMALQGEAYALALADFSDVASGNLGS
jgi:hypothetical protein